MLRYFALLLFLAVPLQAAELPKPDAVFAEPDQASVELGWLLFYDPILSGNKSVACATCHHPRFGTSDGVSLSLGDGASGLGPDRVIDPKNLPEQRIPRNAPALFNLGAEEFSVMFHDGRLEADASKPNGIRTPLGDEMVLGFDSVLSAQAMFPVLSGDEMAGHYSENDISKAVRLGQLTHNGGAWDLISQRVAAIPAYREKFDNVIGADQPIGFSDISNVLADFIAVEWRADDSAFDRYLRGDTAALTQAEHAGMALFYGEAACHTCHAGQFQTDHGFHAIAMPQIGPGKGARFENHHRDTGRMRVTGRAEDAYRFRTPSLRNVTKTGPYGHAGAYASLKDTIRHHLDPVAALRGYTIDAAVLHDLPEAVDTWVLERPEEVDAIAAANDLMPLRLADAQIAELVAFLGALEDPVSLAGRMGVPNSVPSGLPVDR